MGPVITAHPLQLTFAAACADVFAQDPVNHDGLPRRGVAYLVRADRAVTAASVVEGCAVGQPVWLRFSGGVRASFVLAVDPEADCALLELRPAIISQLALTLRRGLSQHGDACQTWSAVPTLRAAGQVVQALVSEPLGEDALRGPAMLLHMVAGSERWHPSLAGSPILHDGYVVGHLRAFASEGGETLLVACPAPYIDALQLSPSATRPPQPPKAGYSPDWYVSRSDLEGAALRSLESPERPLLLRAPDGHGKTWFLQNLLRAQRQRGHLTLYLNVERLPSLPSMSMAGFSELLSDRVQQLPGEPPPLPRALLPDGRALTAEDGSLRAPHASMQRLLRASSGRRVYLALDGLDALRDTMFQDEALALLSSWAQRSSREPGWHDLRLILVSATSPEWLVQPLPDRPLLVQVQELPDLSAAELLELALLHQLQPTPEELLALQSLVGGHPYLARVALYAAAVRGMPLGDVLHRRTGMPTVFDPFLESCQRRVAAQPGLWPTLERLLRGQKLDALDQLLLPRLERMGIVRRAALTTSSGEATYKLRYPLYLHLLEF